MESIPELKSTKQYKEILIESLYSPNEEEVKQNKREN